MRFQQVLLLFLRNSLNLLLRNSLLVGSICLSRPIYLVRYYRMQEEPILKRNFLIKRDQLSFLGSFPILPQSFLHTQSRYLFSTRTVNDPTLCPYFFLQHRYIILNVSLSALYCNEIYQEFRSRIFTIFDFGMHNIENYLYPYIALSKYNHVIRSIIQIRMCIFHLFKFTLKHISHIFFHKMIYSNYYSNITLQVNVTLIYNIFL